MNEVLEALRLANRKFLSEIGALANTEKSSPHKMHAFLLQHMLPIRNYDSLTFKQINQRVKYLTPFELRKVRSYELSHLRRKLILKIVGNTLKQKVFDAL